jgi:hypothetical protein
VYHRNKSQSQNNKLDLENLKIWLLRETTNASTTKLRAKMRCLESLFSSFDRIDSSIALTSSVWSIWPSLFTSTFLSIALSSADKYSRLIVVTFSWIFGSFSLLSPNLLGWSLLWVFLGNVDSRSLKEEGSWWLDLSAKA